MRSPGFALLSAVAFSRPAPDTYGTAARTLPNYRTFGIRNGDFTFMKNFAIAEKKSLQLRAEALGRLRRDEIATIESCRDRSIAHTMDRVRDRNCRQRRA